MDQSPDGSLLAVDRLDRTGYMLIDTASGRTVADVTTDYEIGDYGLAFDPTGSTLAVADETPRMNQRRPSSCSTSLRVDSSVRSPVRPATTAALSSTTRLVAGWGRSGRCR